MTRGFLSDDRRPVRLVDIACEVRRESPSGKAWLIFDGAKEVWIAKSLVEVSNDGTVAMPEWLAAKKGLI